MISFILKLMNKIKTTQEYHKNFLKYNITYLYKKKYRKNFNNYRGVFRVQTLGKLDGVGPVDNRPFTD